MYDFKTFAQMNLDLIFQGFDRMPQPGEEVFAKRFTMQLGEAPSSAPSCWSNWASGSGWGRFWGRTM